MSLGLTKEDLCHDPRIGACVYLLHVLLGVPSFLLPKVTVGFADNHRVGGGFS